MRDVSASPTWGKTRRIGYAYDSPKTKAFSEGQWRLFEWLCSFASMRGRVDKSVGQLLIDMGLGDSGVSEPWLRNELRKLEDHGVIRQSVVMVGDRKIPVIDITTWPKENIAP